MSRKQDRTTVEATGRKAPRLCVLDPGFREDLQWWVETKPGAAEKFLKLMDAALRDPFVGIGKPEPLKQLGPNVRSRRLTQEHRMVYMVFDDRVQFLQGRYHY
jgi:toxin YoeB